jgi:hypothetical protein
MDRFYQLDPKKNEHFVKVFGPDFGVLRTIGDGSCFFHSICSAIFRQYDQLSRKKQQEAGHHLRLKFMSKMNQQLYHKILERLRQKQRGKHFERYSYDEFKQRMNNTKRWADLIVISTVSLLLKLNIIFYDQVGQTFHYGVDENKHFLEKYPTIFILWQDRSHFELIVRKTNKLIERQFHYHKHKRLLDKIINYYNKS